jgi:hypothetical protein
MMEKLLATIAGTVGDVHDTLLAKIEALERALKDTRAELKDTRAEVRDVRAELAGLKALPRLRHRAGPGERYGAGTMLDGR